VDGNLVCAAGVTSGLDGALTVAAMLRGEAAAEAIQLYMQYAPEPPFNTGSPETAQAVAKRLGIAVPSGALSPQRA
jgi:cyclohexyl-isocyanide hydratase